MSTVFGATYAGSYDAFYREKDYMGEVDMLCRALEQHVAGIGTRVLDLGCGTGRHAEILARRGIAVTGVERSPQMAEQARQRARALEGAMRVVEGDVRDVRVEGEFDTALLMFAVLGYQLSNEDVLATLTTARQHLKTGGALAFDVWWGPGVLRDPPGDRVKWVADGEDRVLRVASSELDVSQQLCTVRYRVLRLRGDRVLDESVEAHTMRFFFPREIELLLQTAGFELRRVGGCPDPANDLTSSSWTASVIARAS